MDVVAQEIAKTFVLTFVYLYIACIISNTCSPSVLYVLCMTAVLTASSGRNLNLHSYGSGIMLLESPAHRVERSTHSSVSPNLVR